MLEFRLTGATGHSIEDRQVQDYYATDPIAMELLLQEEAFHKDIWEPAVEEAFHKDIWEPAVEEAFHSGGSIPQWRKHSTKIFGSQQWRSGT